MTDAPAATAPDPAATPDSYLAPAINLIAQLSPAISTLASQSADVKTLLTNLDAAWALPWLFRVGVAVGVCTALRWVYTRALGRRHAWALWIQRAMPWNRA